MAQSIPNPPPGFDDLSIDERVAYIQSLWDRVTAKPEDIPVPDFHREVLNERLAQYQANPGEGRPWGEVREEIEGKLRDRGQKP